MVTKEFVQEIQHIRNVVENLVRDMDSYDHNEDIDDCLINILEDLESIKEVYLENEEKNK